MPLFDATVQATNEWLDDLNQELGRCDRKQAYRMLRAVLVALRDRLTVEEAADFGAQLPTLVRGFYYEGWNPSRTPVRSRTREAFLAQVAENLQLAVDGDPREVTEAVFKILSQRISRGEIEDVRGLLPRDVESLWPEPLPQQQGA